MLAGIECNTSEATRELIIIFDGCTDNSESIVTRTILGSRLFPITKFMFAPDVFEVKANNIGLRESTQPYCMIIQDDMVIQEKDFDKKLLAPFRFSDTFAVTARTAHDNIIKDGTVHHINISGRESGLDKGVFSIRDSCNRGPLLLQHDALEKLNYLDENFAPLHLDDHDLCMRAWKELGMVSGAYMIDYRSDYEWGSSHNPKIAKLSNDSWQKNARILMSRHYEALTGGKHGEERECPYPTQV